VALLFSALAAVLSAPVDSGVTYQTLQWQLMQDSAAWKITTVGAIVGSTTFSVSP
jgi:hypothetical protein